MQIAIECIQMVVGYLDIFVFEELGFAAGLRNPDHGRPVNPLKIPLKRYSFTY